MKRSISVVVAPLLAVMFTAGLAAAQSEAQPDRAVVTFDSPTEVPGTVLPAGTYVFKSDAVSGDVVQVFDEKEEDIIAQWISVQVDRLPGEVTDQALVAFTSKNEDATDALQYWFQGDERVGREFIYPEEQAREITKRTGSDVRTDADADEER